MTLKDLLKDEEGFRSKPYRCTAGKLTIGYGRNLEDRGITKEEAEYLLDNDIKAAISACRETFAWFAFLDNVRQAVVCDMVFNLGIGGFLEFKKAIAAIREKNWEKAADEMKDSDWYKQVRKRAVQLTVMMRTGRFEK